MCGIFGFLGHFDPGSLSAMAAALAHRGPDDRGLYFESSLGIGLGQTRLSIIDLSATGHQPMTDASARYVVVYNGEIYNYRELRAELEAQGVTFRGHSDTEVMLEWYARIGPQVLDKLNGIFAIGVWDTQKRELFVARDGLGVKPLYFTKSPRGFAFASELKALLPVLDRRTLDPASLHRYLSYLWCPGERTPIREAHQLHPGEAMVVRDGSIQGRWTWYELPARSGPGPTLPDSEVVPSTTAMLRAAVHRQLVSDVPIGAFLSGGLDSSAVVAFARERTPDLQCFTIDMKEHNDAGFADDLPYARCVAEHLKVPLHVVSVEASRMANDLEQMVWMLDEPLADPAPLNVLYISRLARANGIKVLLSGAGGDDLYTGYRRHLALRYEQLWTWLPSAARRALQTAATHLDAGTAFGRRAQRLFGNAGATVAQRLAGYFAWAPEDRLRALYAPAFARELGVERADAPMVEFIEGMAANVTPLEQMLALEQRFFLPDHNLAYTDRMSMAAGVEVRVPFLDIDLVEHAARIPDRFKQHGHTGKWVLKKAMEPHLPHDVIYRPKTGFGAPLRSWLQHELLPLADELLSTRTLLNRGLFDPAAVRTLRDADAGGRVDAAYTLLSLMNIEIWCRRFIDGPAAT
jgi:asparagine synthase (glutamine-hydrolysing)